MSSFKHTSMTSLSHLTFANTGLGIDICVSLPQVLVAFMVGMTNLYRYYGTHVINPQDDTRASEAFRGFVLCSTFLC